MTKLTLKLGLVGLCMVCFLLISACSNGGSTDNQPPQAVIDIDASTGGAPLTVTVDGSQSLDSDGSIASYTWRFGNTQAQGVTATHTFTEAGTYTVTLTVSDDQGATDSEQLTVTVLPNNQAPTANFTASVETGNVPLEVRFDASISTDADGIITSYTWDFGDGSSATGVTADHTFTEAGIYQVTLTVTDNSGAISETQTTINVTTPNQPPTAVLTATPLTGEAPLEVSFDATNSIDADGIITSYLWDFGDGAATEGESVTHTYQDVGTYTVTLTLQDDAGTTVTETATVTVTEPNQVPTAAFTLAPVVGVFKGVIYVDIPFGEEVVIVDFDGSTSSDPDGDNLSYAWDFGDGSRGEGMQTSHVYEHHDTHLTVTLTVTDARGASHESSIQLSVTKRILPPLP